MFHYYPGAYGRSCFVMNTFVKFRADLYGILSFALSDLRKYSARRLGNCENSFSGLYNCLVFAIRRKEGNVLFNDALNTFYLRLYGVRHMVKDHSDSERGNPLPPHGLLFPISSKGSFICTISQTG